MASEAYETLNRAWKSTCKTILGGEVGELDDFRKWLSEPLETDFHAKSAVSGKDIYYAVPYYRKDAKYISLDEVDFNKKFQPLSINEMKDIDSIMEAVKERIRYTGNIILMNSKFVEKSSNVTNSHFIYNSSHIYDSKYAAYVYYLRFSEYVFGTNNDCFSSHLIRGWDTYKTPRSFEIWSVLNCPDSYYSFGIEDCSNVLFSFNVKGKHHVIGNAEVGPERFKALKEKLLEDIRDEMKAKKKAPSLLELVAKSGSRKEIPKGLAVDYEELGESKTPMEEAFRKTTKVVLGRELQDMDAYEKWLVKNLKWMTPAKSVMSGKTTFIGHRYPYPLLPKERLVKGPEASALGERLRLEDRELGSIGNIKDSLGKIAFFKTELVLGTNRNIIDCPTFNQSVNCYRGALFSESENCSFSFWPRNSKYMFGCEVAFSSNFCINSRYSANLSRCLEVDGSSSCADLYYSHNCENVNDSMFCFNVKNLRYAVGNGALSPLDYKKVKETLLGQMADELERKKELKWSVYDIGAKG
ncbi:MAG: hypothetical protein ACP5NX_00355 [Candidatus Bilamarchaeaceae archaeon]